MTKPRTQADSTPAPKRRWTEADYKSAGYGTIKLRLPEDTLQLLGLLADDRGLSRAQLVAELIDEADRQHAIRALR